MNIKNLIKKAVKRATISTYRIVKEQELKDRKTPLDFYIYEQAKESYEPPVSGYMSAQ